MTPAEIIMAIGVGITLTALGFAIAFTAITDATKGGKGGKCK